MRVSVNWLERFMPGVKDVRDLAESLTDIGLEVEDEEGPWPTLDRTVVARVRRVRRMQGSRSRTCEVDAGAHGMLSVVCGAPNVRRGMRAPLALLGAPLPGGIVEARSFGDVVSEGMLCSAAELGLGEEEDVVMELGRMAKPGMPVAELLETADRVLDLAVTPNRGDWLSVLGVARELCAKTGAKVRKPRITKLPSRSSTDDMHEVSIEKDALPECPKFTCLPVSGVRVDRPTPALIAERLRRCGVRPVSIVVDITNYVMLETGQPLHAFDRDQINGVVRIRFAKDGESLVLLDGTEASLTPHYLLVADAKGPLALGGVMGGLPSGVTEGTANILLEAAHFVPSVIRGRTRSLNISSEAAFRFERGVDPYMCEVAITKAAKLVMKHCGGSCGRLNVAGAQVKARPPVTIRHDKVERLTGVAVTPATSASRLKALGFGVERRRGESRVSVPSWRFDIERPEDLVEEIVRLGGYSSVPTTMPRLVGGFIPAPERLLDPELARDRLVAQGYSEILTFAFVDPRWESDFYGNDKPLALSNPLAKEQGVMRSGLIGGLVDRAVYNRYHRQDSLRLFEIGRCFPRGEAQPNRIAGLCWGPVEPDHWDRAKRDHDFYDARGAIERLLPSAELDFLPDGSHPALHPGRCARVIVAGKDVGATGELHPALIDKNRYDLVSAPAMFELDLDALCAMRHGRRADDVSKFPQVRRDLALTVDVGVDAGQLVKSATALAIEEVTDITVFDSYSGGQLEEGKRSVGLRITMQGTKANMVDSRINEVLEALAEELSGRHGATVRR